MHRTMKVLLASAAFNIFWMPLTAHGNLLRANREEKSAANESTQSRKVRSFFDFVDFVNYVLRNALARPFDFLIWYSLDLFASQLLWNFVPTSKEVNNNNSYDNYDDKEVPSDTSINDPVDFLRSTDVCYKNGSYSLSNCPTPPNCNFSGKFGAAKLCINRVPRPGDFQYYVMVMKCIPQWENCDKCMCGHINSDADANANCIYTGGKEPPNDDYVTISCDDPSTVKFQSYLWTVVPP